MICRTASILALALTLVAGSLAVADTRPPVSYGRDIRPILSDKCFHCHGPDADSRQADLRLDTREGVTTKVVVAGKPDESEIIKRIFSSDADEQMPPPDSKITLSAEQKELLRRWVSEGAPFAEHWAFQPLPDKVTVPPIVDNPWPREPLDNFVLAKLQSEKLTPTSQASALRLLRRITLDLTGLPPTAEECRAFEDDPAPLEKKYAAAVERLLASSAFGEHMAVAWLDAARYGDSYGYHSDLLNTFWPYRDWVVRALNDNLPYDKFLTWQLAGDLLPNATRDQTLGTAFNRLNRMTNEGGSIDEELRNEGVSDRVHTLGTAVLGLTVECCRCHDHKYDPLTMRDYYSLTAFFNSIDENGLYDSTEKVPAPSLALPTPEQETQLAAAKQKVADSEAALAKTVTDGGERLAAWLAAPKPASDADLVVYYTFDSKSPKLRNEAPGVKGEADLRSVGRVGGVHGRAAHFDGDAGATFPKQFEIDRWDAFTLDFLMRDNDRSPQPVVIVQRTFGTDVGFNGFDIMLHDGILETRLYRIWPGNGIGVVAKKAIPAKEWQHVAVSYDGSSKAAGLKIFVNGAEVDTTVLQDHIFKSAAVRSHGTGILTLGERFRGGGFKNGDIDDFRAYMRALSPLEIQDLHDGAAMKLALADAEGHRDELSQYFFSAVDADARKAAAELRAARQAFVQAEDSQQEIPVMREMAKARPTYVLPRGAYDAPKTEANRVGRETFSKILLPFPKDAPRNRLGLAQWLTDPRHPLTARVFVNRVWAQFFGRGIVATPENFGQQGALPSNQELLDWLARDFVEHGWDIKRLCRTIVLSATYQQDSRCSRELRARDPENELLARGPSHRLSGEEIRDLALAASGLIDRRMGGPPVSPYQPGEDLWREANSMSPAYQQSAGKDLYRRSLYSVWKRTAPLPNMSAFDAPTREVCTVNRSRTNTPLQALVLLNDTQFVEAARALACDVAKSSLELDQQLDEMFLRLAGRHPDEMEKKLLASSYREQLAAFEQTDNAELGKFLKLGETKLDSKLSAAQVAALTVICQSVLNLDATIMER